MTLLNTRFFLFFSLLICTAFGSAAQTKPNPENLIYVDKAGVIRYSKTKQEAAFYGVNYCLPFAYGYRAVKSLNIKPETAIDQDVYHIARMGADAFRVHVWDTEISDSLGNLLNNEHLRLFDYLVAQLKKRQIKIIITPIAYWGNGYPERDEHTPGFSRVYGKGQANQNENAIKAQEEYVRQFFRHVNPYTKSTYGNDQDVIAVELNNEPTHAGPKPKVTEYINRINAAVRSTGWDKPIFYNISQNPWYADAVAKSDVNGFSFQWYPLGLVAGHTIQGNSLLHVDKYHIPFDTIPAFKNKARIVYEFDAGDVYAPYMYPAMARSFRGAGFQWATQFAYDPMATAYANTEYQTHYLNLAYTPSKAISMLIAGRVFRETPRFKTYGAYPQDSLFGPFRLSYSQSLSEMNSDRAFFYANTTQTKPVNAASLTQIAGVGSSPVVHYEGTGAYFLDKVGAGVWRLEVMPDAILIRDPFERPSLKKEVTTIRYAAWPMRVSLPDLGTSFAIVAQNEGNSFAASAINGGFQIRPGTYLLKTAGAKTPASMPNAVIGLNEFYAPAAPDKTEPILVHTAYGEVSANQPLTLSATIVGLDSADKAVVEFRNGRLRTVPLQRVAGYRYEANVPGDWLTSGLLNYRIVIQKGIDYRTYPGAHPGDPTAWDYLPNDTYQTIVTAENSRLNLFDASTDRVKLIVNNSDYRNNTVELAPDENPSHLLLKASFGKASTDPKMGLQYYFGDKIQGRKTELTGFTKLVVRGKSGQPQPVTVKVSLISNDGTAYSTVVNLPQQMSEIEVPLSQLTNDAMPLLPRPYPDFQPLTFQPANAGTFSVTTLEKVDMQLGQSGVPEKATSVWLDYIGLTR
ncbi:cellulase family glycosylhydrolase [Fibrella aquatica]|uniref:cellulase family glycosylhydrolase n=1 Tax=Fibrella aquatica TaxID=3242487 RepID=UPI00351F883C